MAEPEHPGLPESNAAAVISRLLAKASDLDGEGFVSLMRLLLARAEQIRAVRQRAATFDQRLLSGQVADQQEANAELLEALYEPLCLNWFLSRIMKSLAEDLEFSVYQQQGHLRPVKQITFTEQGEVENFRLAPPVS
jgi:hypothetical protein